MRPSAYDRHVEREFIKLGRQIALPAHRRVRELIESLKPDFPITGLSMGMGLYCLLGDDVPVTYSDGSEGTVEMVDLFEFIESRKIWEPTQLTKRNLKTLRELKEWLDWITDEPYIPLFQCGKEPVHEVSSERRTTMASL